MNLIQRITIWKINRLEKGIIGYDKLIAKLKVGKKKDQKTIKELLNIMDGIKKDEKW